MSNEENAVVKVDLLPFMDILKRAIQNENILNSYVSLDKKTVDLLLTIIDQNPEYFIGFETTLVNITKDNKVDSKDLPDIITMIQKFYEILFKQEIKLDTIKCSEICGETTKLLIHVLVKNDKIKIDDEKKTEFLEQSDKLIDVCVNLLKLGKQLKLGKTNGCLKTLFAYKK